MDTKERSRSYRCWFALRVLGVFAAPRRWRAPSRSAANHPVLRRRRARAPRSTSPATGSRSSPKTGGWRMLTPQKGDYSSVPLSAEGRKVADTWDPAKAASRWVQAVRRGGDHARAGAAAHRVGQRHHVENRDRCRAADAAAELRQVAEAAGGTDVAGALGRRVGAHPSARRPGRQHSAGAAARRLVESRHDQSPRGIPAQERRALQRGHRRSPSISIVWRRWGPTG